MLSPHTLLMGMQNDAATEENSLAVHQMVRHVTTSSDNSAHWHLCKRSKNICFPPPPKIPFTGAFSAALFIVAKMCEQSKHVSIHQSVCGQVKYDKSLLWNIAVWRGKEVR